MSKHYTRILLAILLLLGIAQDVWATLTSLSKSDPFPIFTSLDPHLFLYTREKLQLKGYETVPGWTEYIGFSISPFGQNANNAKTFDEKYTEIGDVCFGRWGMIALLYGATPQGQSLGPLLLAAQQQLFPGGMGLNDPDYIDIHSLPVGSGFPEQFTQPPYLTAIDSAARILPITPTVGVGFFTVPACYRKRGVRFEMDAKIFCDFGIKIQTGLADICQTPTSFINLTPDCVPAGDAAQNWLGNSCCNRPIPKCDINEFLMEKLKKIAIEVGLDIAPFHEFSIEEIRLQAWWRHAFPINQNEEEWPEFLLIPFFELGGSISPGKQKDPNKFFGIGFGNNGFGSLGFTGGLNFDFYDTIEIGGEVGYTHFIKRNCMQLRVANSPCQTGIFPFTTDVSYQPGDNWYFGAKMYAWHFLEHLSMYFQYVILQHGRDKIVVLNEDPAFHPEVNERFSDWKVHLANVGFTYDISPNISLGGFWQAPLAQQRVYRSSTLMFSFNVDF